MNIKVAANNRFDKPCYFFQQVIWHERHKRLAALVYIVQCKHLILICSNCYTAGKKTIGLCQSFNHNLSVQRNCEGQLLLYC